VRRFLVKRLLEVIPVVIGITTLAFALIHLVPGDPARIELGPTATPAALAHLRDQLGLNHPLIEQYWRFMSDAFTGSFGTSLQYQQPVSSIIGPRITASALLICYSLLIAIIVALPLAMLSALQRDRWPDHLVRLFTTATFGMPSFWLGLMLSLVVGVHLGWLPTSGYDASWPGRIESLTLPAITVGLFLAPPLLRTLRSSLIDNLGAEYTETVRARGLGSIRVVLKHVLRNSATSSITLLGLSVGTLLSGTVVVEQVFAVPGLGSLLVSSVVARDFPIVEALTFIFGLTVVVVSLITDIVYAAIDPRVRL
jgi:peptide/nickel transport system permease protein